MTTHPGVYQHDHLQLAVGNVLLEENETELSLHLLLLLQGTQVNLHDMFGQTLGGQECMD